LWFGGLFFPEAFLTATRQAAAQANGWALENLDLHVEIIDESAAVTVDPSSFIAYGISLEGAGYQRNQLVLSNDISTPLARTKFTWKHRTESQTSKVGKVSLPVYLNDTRADFLVAVDFDAPQEIPFDTWYQRCVALTVWKPS
jgi:dynein heavy chain 1